MKHNGEDYKFYSRCICGAITLNMNGKFCSFLESEKSKIRKEQIISWTGPEKNPAF